MILLDTHIVIWLAQEPELLSSAAESAVRTARHSGGLAISDKTLWELARTIADKDLEVKTSPLQFLETCARTFTVLPITPAIALQAVQFSRKFPRDPADCLIAATAVVHRIPLVTKDGKIRKSGEVACIW